MPTAGNFTEAQQGEIKFPEITGPILEKVRSPTPLTEGPVRSSSAPKLLSQPFAPTPAPTALAIVLAVGPAPVAPAPGATPHPGPLLTPVWQTVQYFYYKLRYTNHQGTLPEFKIEPEHALELLMAANYLDT